MAIKIFLLLSAYGVFSAAEDILPCQYAKFHANHSACKPANAACNTQMRNVTAYDIHVIMDTHNQLRQKVALGNESGQPPAADMKMLKWDSELAFIAQKLADQCRNERDCDSCRQVERFRVGQQLRIWRRSSSANASYFPEWEETITSWYKAVNAFNSGLVKQYSFALSYGTYSQLVWANTSFVGCGFSSYTKDDKDEKLYVCNYGPTGNIISEEMYKVGPACESCPENWVCSKNYPGLCTENEAGNFSINKESVYSQASSNNATNTTEIGAANTEASITDTNITFHSLG